MLNAENIPKSLKDRRQWVLWKTVLRSGSETKVPFSVNGQPAKSNDPTTWASFIEVLAQADGFDGIGFMFSDADPYCGIDLDGCRDPDTGFVAKWAVDIVREMGTYAEISPSQTGIKLIAIGALPGRTGLHEKLTHEPHVSLKAPGIEMYDHGRYFAMTGLRIDDNRPEPEERIPHIKALHERYRPALQASSSSEFFAPQSVIDRARKYLMKCPPAISGQGGHKATFRTACILRKGFLLSDEQTMLLIKEWNETCVPPWTDKELHHKIEGAKKAPGKTGYLRNVKPDKWAAIEVPDYENDQLAFRQLVSIGDAAQGCIDRIRRGAIPLARTGLPLVDEAIGGGIEQGEMVIIAARPGHGKSAIALQCAHNFTADGLPVLFVAEEMSAYQLGKRTLQFASTVPAADWEQSTEELESHLQEFTGPRAACYVVQNCSTSAAAVAEIERAVDEHGVKVAIVDYAQLLSSPGHGRYENVTNTSIALRRVTTEKNIILVALCQLNREVEHQLLFEPKNHHLKDSGQLEQDADVIIFLVWPSLIDKDVDRNEFRFHITKNRNREIIDRVVKAHFDPARQMVIAGMNGSGH